MRISKRTREQAALICAMAASNRCWPSFAATWAGIPKEAVALVDDLTYEMSGDMDLLCDLTQGQFYAEAEALLRTGWTP